MDHSLHLPTTFRRRSAAPPDTSLRLAAHATLAGHLAAGTCIAVQAGRVWLTQSGDADDHFIGAGQRHVVARAGQVVIEGDAPSTTLRISAGVSSARPGFP